MPAIILKVVFTLIVGSSCMAIVTMATCSQGNRPTVGHFFDIGNNMVDKHALRQSWFQKLTVETLRFQDEDDYEDEIFQYQSSARASTTVISAGKRDGRRHSTTSFSENVVVAKTSYRNVRSYHLRSGEGLTSFNKNNRANFSGEKSEMKLSGVSIFLAYAKKLKIKCRPRSRPRPRI